MMKSLCSIFAARRSLCSVERKDGPIIEAWYNPIRHENLSS